MTEINQENFVLFFQVYPIQIISVIFVLFCQNDLPKNGVNLLSPNDLTHLIWGNLTT